MSKTPNDALTPADEDVSPMAAQNTGPERTGPAEEPLRQTRPVEADETREVASAAMPKGGERATRDDL